MIMGIVGGVIQLLVIALPAILAAIARRNEIASKPDNILSKKNETTDIAIAKNDAAAVSIELNTLLGQLQERGAGGYSGGSNGQV